MTSVKPKSAFPLVLLLVVLVVGAVGVSVFLRNKRSKKAKILPVEHMAEESAPTAAYRTTFATQKEVKVEKLEEDVPLDYNKEFQLEEDVDHRADEDIPNTAFPNMQSSEDDEDAQLAQAFTYDNLQDSMLTSGKEAREAIKSRDAWSRFGQRGNPEIWEAQMAEMKKEIDASGQSIEQFMENTWAPIPEQMAAFWKDAKNSKQEVFAPTAAPIPNRQALSEAAGLTRDATQMIPKFEGAAKSVMKDMLAARKRAKVLGLNLPSLTKEQSNDLKKLSINSNKELSGLAVALTSI